MPTLWQTITTNSTLPVQAGNTFWLHLNNQAGGGGPTQLVVIEAFVDAQTQIDVSAESFDVDVEIDGLSIDVSVDDGVTT